jgi:hypothetical protein
VVLEILDPSHVSRGPTILAFEFASTRSHAERIVAEWGTKGRSAAHLWLLLDYGYMLSYGLFFALAGFTVRRYSPKSWLVTSRGRRHDHPVLRPRGRRVRRLRKRRSACENVALLLILAGNGGSFAPPFAAVCSALKFTLIGIAILYALCGFAAWLRARLLGREQQIAT